MTNLDKLRWIQLPSHKDDRGVLTAIEAEQDIPIAIQRVFYMHNIHADRGGHVHPYTDQVVIAAAGSFDIILSDDREQHQYTMDDPTKGLYVPRMVFIDLKNFSPGAVCLVLANTYYDHPPIRTWEGYLEALRAWRSKGPDHD